MLCSRLVRASLPVLNTRRTDRHADLTHDMLAVGRNGASPGRSTYIGRTHVSDSLSSNRTLCEALSNLRCPLSGSTLQIAAGQSTESRTPRRDRH